MWRIFLPVGIFSLLINMLGLTGSLFMLQVYDRVIPSKSLSTLAAFSLLALLLYTFYGFLDVVRSRVLVRIGSYTESTLTAHVFRAIAGLSLRQTKASDALRPSRELEDIKLFLNGSGLATLFDLPWLPFYLAICFYLSPFIGLLALGAMCVLGILNALAVIMTLRLTSKFSQAIAQRNAIGESVSRNAELVEAMGMGDHSAALWEKSGIEASDIARRMSDISSFYSGLSKIIRNAVQSASLGVGAFLVIQGELSGGAIIAGSIVVARTLAPVEQMIAQWRGAMQAQQAWKNLRLFIREFPEAPLQTQLPAPHQVFTIENAFVAIPGQQQAYVSNINLRVEAGTVLGVIGPSGSGKSTLIRAMTGVWPLLRGRVALDGAGLEQWSAADRGRFIGYMPQSSEFFPGTIANNIARLDPNADHETIVRAAKAAGAHELIVTLTEGYDTWMGSNGAGLSAGQRQRVALARALYADPFLVVLDEPNSNLDGAGEAALAKAIASVRARGGIVIVAAHRQNLVAQSDLLLVMEDGFAKAFGPREAILKAIQQQQNRFAANRAVGPALAVIDNEGGNS